MDGDLAGAEAAEADGCGGLVGTGAEPAIAGDLAGGDEEGDAVGDPESEQRLRRLSS